MNPILQEMEEEQKRDWKDELKENWLSTRLAFQGMMLGRIERQQLAEEEMARHVRQLAGVNGQPQDEGEEMGVSIGNKIFHHHEAQTPSDSSGKGSWLQKAAVAVALLAGGSGLGYVAGQLGSEVVDTDTDTTSVIDFPD